jgi:phospholipid/cholesterol/gamma-HCH transport system permease protein
VAARETRIPLVEPLGEASIQLLTFVGEVWMLLADVGRRLCKRPIEWEETFNQMAFIGVASVPIVVLTGFFSGAVFSLYFSQFLSSYGATYLVGASVGLTVTRELGPVFTGIMVAARCGSAMAAQIGTMAVTEQIDALRMLSVNPTNYLVIPRLLAGLLMLPVLALVCIWSGIVGGLLIGEAEGVPSAVFMHSINQYVAPTDFIYGCLKTPVFGVIITVVACQQGLRTTQGAVGVGRATTNTVVISMVLLFISNFLLARVMF